mgnify:CR=1 FL=1|jgi:hypothetical protein
MLWYNNTFKVFLFYGFMSGQEYKESFSEGEGRWGVLMVMKMK